MFGRKRESEDQARKEPVGQGEPSSNLAQDDSADDVAASVGADASPDGQADLSGLDVVVADMQVDSTAEAEDPSAGTKDSGSDVSPGGEVPAGRDADDGADLLRDEDGSGLHPRDAEAGFDSLQAAGESSSDGHSSWDDDVDDPVYDDDFASDDDSLQDYDTEFDDFSYGADEAPLAANPAPAVAPAPARARGGNGAKHAAHASKPVSKRQRKKEERRRLLEQLPDHQVKSRRQRRGLIVVLLLLLVLVCVLGFLCYRFLVVADLQPVQQENQTEAVRSSEAEGEVKDSGSASQRTEIPQLVSLFGMTQDEAVKALGHGATLDSSQEVNEADSNVKKRVGLKLTEEPGDAKSGQPTVYLGLDEDGKVIETSYSTATGYLGYGAVSLGDIISNDNIVENTLSDAGLVIDDANLKLPDDPSEYRTYDTDGETVVKERVSFDGSAPGTDGNDYDWAAVITYDYTAANLSLIHI